jgi:hypothetical protein
VRAGEKVFHDAFSELTRQRPAGAGIRIFFASRSNSWETGWFHG